MRLVDAGIAEHNARPDRRTATARGRSFDATFDEGYAASVIRRASAEQRRLWLLAAEGVKVRREGYVVLAGNAYFGEAVSALAGQHVVVRFDPDRLDQPVHVHTPGGAYVGAAERTTARFDDIDTAREHARAHRARQRAARGPARGHGADGGAGRGGPPAGGG
ncbi:Mu transposase C-terminal domain-containing protein [Thermomonas sp. S9]|nr:Mu transposase C-terminal domain-containing protein [Thermomonas sp. S9]